jgi:hypothetical protein
MRPQTNERDYDRSEFWSSVEEHASGACTKKLCLYCVANGVSLKTQKRERLIETEIRAAYAALGTQLATPGLFGSPKWNANSQYGYYQSEHESKEEAEQVALDYYAERMNLIRQ